MQKVSCDGGCANTEDANLPDSKRKIRPVRLTIHHDQRESMTNAQDKYMADLCDDCQRHLLNKFFRVAALDGGKFREEREPIVRAAQ